MSGSRYHGSRLEVSGSLAFMDTELSLEASGAFRRTEGGSNWTPEVEV